MAFLRKKTINGKERYYLEHSIRMLNGKIKKISVYIKNKENTNKFREILNEKIKNEIIKDSASYYRKDDIITEELLKELEGIRLDYKKIKNKLTDNQLKDVIDRFAINFTYESNALEGNSLTLKDVAVVFNEKKSIENKDLREIYETINTREALNLIFKNKIKINERDIIRLHEILMKNTGVSFGYKKIPNFLLGRNLKTTAPENVEKEMKKLLEWYKESKKLHPLERAAIFHGRFEQIHPFEDGNGRVGRLLINIILLQNNYPPLIIRKTERLSYLSSLEAFDNKYEDKLKRFIIERYKNTFEKFFMIYIKYL